jgi:Holliday junction DNA helicase RuvB
LLDFIREISVVESTLESPINEKDVMRGLAILGIDPSGLTELDRKYLKLLHYDRPVGLQYIAAVLSTDVTTVQEEIEPYLIQAGLVERTAKGRLLGGSIEAFKARILEEAKNFIP